MRKCYRNATALGRSSLGNSNARAMAGGDFPHDGEAEPAAGAGGARHAIETLEHTLALARRNPRSVVFHLEESVAVGAPGAHGDVRAALRVLDRVVHQVGERLAQQKRIALHRRPFELEAEVD